MKCGVAKFLFKALYIIEINMFLWQSSGTIVNKIRNLLVYKFKNALFSFPLQAYELSLVSPKYLQVAVFSMIGVWITSLTQSLATILGKEDDKPVITCTSIDTYM